MGTAERIRDKIAASKKKGMWMGGISPLGYDAVEKKLVINEAETVRTLFGLYLTHANMTLVKQEADRRGLRTKIRKPNNGKRRGGAPFTRGHLYKLLSNPIYCLTSAAPPSPTRRVRVLTASDQPTHAQLF